MPRICNRIYVNAEPAELWTRIGRLDRACRRSTWARVETIEGPPSNEIFYDGDDFVAVELCGGREGDDAFVRVERDNPAFEGLLDVVQYAIGNIDEEEEDAEMAARDANRRELDTFIDSVTVPSPSKGEKT